MGVVSFAKSAIVVHDMTVIKNDTKEDVCQSIIDIDIIEEPRSIKAGMQKASEVSS